MFLEVLATKQAGNEQLANFYVERFPPDVRKAYDAWLAQRPFENPNAAPHPFVPRLYEPRGTREAAAATAKAASTLKTARSAGNISGQYLANVRKVRATARAFGSVCLRGRGLLICARTDGYASLVRSRIRNFSASLKF